MNFPRVRWFLVAAVVEIVAAMATLAVRARAEEPAQMERFVVNDKHLLSFGVAISLWEEKSSGRVLEMHVTGVQAGGMAEQEGVIPGTRVYGINGRDIYSFMATFGSGGKKLPRDATERTRLVHVMGSQRIDFTGPRTAHDVGMWMGFTNNTPDKSASVAEFGHYEDKYVKVGGRWYFQERRIYNERISNKALYYPELGERDPREK